MGSQLKVTVDSSNHVIDKNIYGHFAEHLGRCIYGGLWVGPDSTIPNTRGLRNDVIDALKRMSVPILRWPGGCFADEYHWQDGVGSHEARPKMINNHWGGIVENNHFGTHEFFDLCEQIGAQPYVCGNVGSGSIREMQQWVEYITFDGDSPMANLRKQNGQQSPWNLKYFGIGNENWGCGGRMRAEYYADLYRQYSTYIRNYGAERMVKIAAGPRADDYHWTEVLMREAGYFMDGLALHYYTRVRDHSIVIENPDRNRIYLPDPHANRGQAVEFDERDWFAIMKAAYRTEELVERHSAIMDRYDPDKRVALIIDEWGTWFEVEPGTNPAFLYQQNTMRDAVSAAISLNIFNNHSDRVRMANIAQIVNVLQAVILTEGDKLVLTPTYHVFEMYKVHQGATMASVELNTSSYAFGEETLPQISASASLDASGKLNITLCNVHPHGSATIDCSIGGYAARRATGRVLVSSSMNAHNTFDSPDIVKPETFTDVRIGENGFSATIPPMSVVSLTLEA